MTLKNNSETSVQWDPDINKVVDNAGNYLGDLVLTRTPAAPHLDLTMGKMKLF